MRAKKIAIKPYMEEITAFCDKLTKAQLKDKKRIDHIVSNKHRNAYARVAQVLCSLAETYKVMDQDNKARRLIDHYNKKYNRFSAFKREVNTAMRSSVLLK